MTATATAASDGRPPIFSATPIAIGIVADLGASDISSSCDPPSSQAMPTADAIAATEPTSSATPIGSHSRRSRPTWPHSGTASATRGGTDQEMHELRAFEVGVVGRVRDQQHADDHAHRDQHRVDERVSRRCACAATAPRGRPAA